MGWSEVKAPLHLGGPEAPESMHSVCTDTGGMGSQVGFLDSDCRWVQAFQISAADKGTGVLAAEGIS